MAPPAGSSPDTRRIVKVLALAAFTLLALCGVAGTCLLLVSFFVPQ